MTFTLSSLAPFLLFLAGIGFVIGVYQHVKNESHETHGLAGFALWMISLIGGAAIISTFPSNSSLASAFAGGILAFAGFSLAAAIHDRKNLVYYLVGVLLLFASIVLAMIGFGLITF